jgi:ectoine hydroxylase-related dioxygenase (phytanoyl-CoA dioxygenase family)
MNEINWVYWPDPRSVTRKNNAQIVYPEYGQDANLIAYSRAYEKRKLKYPNFSPSNEATQIAMEIEEKGYTIIENYFPIELIETISQKTKDILDNPLHPSNKSKKNLEESRKTELYTQVEQPLLSVDEFKKFAFDDFIIDVAGAYLDCFPAFNGCNLRTSYVNNLPEGGNQRYHVDPNSPRYLKAFIYLNDVDKEGGPFSCIEGSHTKKFEIIRDGFSPYNWNEQYVWDEKFLHQIYGEENVKYLTAKKGDLIFCDTNAWHRGFKPIKSERTMITLDYICHIPSHSAESYMAIRKSDYEKIDHKYKDLCDLLRIFDDDMCVPPYNWSDGKSIK